MKLFYKNTPFAISCIIFGLTNILIHFNLIELESKDLFSFIMIYLGVHLVYQEINKHRPGLLSLGVTSFFIGLTLFVFNRINVFFLHKTILGVTLFIIGMIFLFLFLNNTKQKVFMEVGIISVFVSLISIYFIDYLPFHQNIKSLNRYIFDIRYFILAFVGFILITNRKE